MRLIPYFNFHAFDAAKDLLISQGHTVISPADIDRAYGFDPLKMTFAPDYNWDVLPDTVKLTDCIERDLAAVLRAEAVYMLRGWENSVGARTEHALAEWAKKQIFYEIGPQPGCLIQLPTKIEGDPAPTAPGTVKATEPVSTSAEATASAIVQDIVTRTLEAMVCVGTLTPEQAHDWLDFMSAVLATPSALPASETLTTPVALLSERVESKPEPATGSGEVRTVDPATGGEKGTKLARFDLVPTQPLWELAELYGRGARKYAARNWERGYDWSLSFAACQRHLSLFWSGEDRDPETGAKHVINAAWHCFALAYFMDRFQGKDDRPRPGTT